MARVRALLAQALAAELRTLLGDSLTKDSNDARFREARLDPPSPDTAFGDLRLAVQLATLDAQSYPEARAEAHRPLAHLEPGGEAVFSYPPDPRTLIRTVRRWTHSPTRTQR